MNYSTRRQRIAAEVRAEMARQRITIPSLSETTGVPLSTLRRRCDGHAAFDTDELDLVSNALGLRPSELLARAEPPMAVA